MFTTTEKVLMRRMPATEKPGLKTCHFAETVQADNFPMPFKAHINRVVQRARTDNGLFQDLGSMTLIAAISHWSKRAREIPEIAEELETLAKRYSRVDLPRNGAELQLLVRQLNTLDLMLVRENSLRSAGGCRTKRPAWGNE